MCGTDRQESGQRGRLGSGKTTVASGQGTLGWCLLEEGPPAQPGAESSSPLPPLWSVHPPGQAWAASGGSRWDVDVILGKRQPESWASEGQWFRSPSRAWARGGQGGRVSRPWPGGSGATASGSGWERSPRAGGPGPRGRCWASPSPHLVLRAVSGARQAAPGPVAGSRQQQ